MLHVPYRGTAPAITDLISSHIDLMFTEMASAIELHKSGRARILGVSAHDRSPLLPDIPTFIESGVPDFISDTWNAISAPPKTPPAIVAKLNKTINDVLHSPEAQAHFAAINLRAAAGNAAEASAFIQRETKVWGEVIKAAGVSAN
jgi:tripartite-type tricarboxylate transporter receptor subunit TctC